MIPIFANAQINTYIIIFQSFSDPMIQIHMVTLGFGILVLLGIMLIVVQEKIYKRFPGVLSITIWILLLAIINVYYNIPGRHRKPPDDVAITFYTIIVCYMMLPLSKRWSLGLGLVTMVLEMSTVGFLTKEKHFLVHQVSFCIYSNDLFEPKAKTINFCV